MAEPESGNQDPKAPKNPTDKDFRPARFRHDRWVTMPPEGWTEDIWGTAAAAAAEGAGREAAEGAAAGEAAVRVAASAAAVETGAAAAKTGSATVPATYWPDQPAAAAASDGYEEDGQAESRGVKAAKHTVSLPVNILRRAVRDVIVPLAIAFAVAMFAQATVAKPYQIPSGSMLPTIQLQDRILANRLVYRFHPIQRDDVVVFTPPAGLEQDIPYVKRVIGIPGDTVETKGGHTYVNGVVHDVPEATLPTYTKDPVTVPDGMLYVLGDNRNESSDSHFWGFVPEDNVIGRADVIYWPPHDFRFLGL